MASELGTDPSISLVFGLRPVRKNESGRGLDLPSALFELSLSILIYLEETLGAVLGRTTFLDLSLK